MSDSVLVLSGLDPCGGAGIAADIETINQFGVTPLPIITTLTVQNTQSVKSTQEVDSKLIAEQFNHLKTDVTFSVAKIGLLSSKKQIEVLTNLLSECDDVTIVLDPIVKSTAKDKLLDSQTLEVLKTKLLPLVDVITPNVDELQALSPNKNEQQAVESLPCEWVLLTTTDSSNDEIEHRLYHHAELLERYTYTKLPGDYHGSGCTLASSIAGLLALGVETRIACKRALDYTYQTLLNAKSIGKMQHHPNRQKP
ncbi:hydroxymethylpyrimidine/phosphomethylpyrimidine kinase [uncultured Candidatus Thioglobus sp.]|uniref:bifunctional hydroxymethylpyrimidine kinase/phosphomethylpyrimidine kinase n=3 Tax=Candidatus Thioglobus TaxID=655184 RepID=UPI0001BAC4EC|nr:hydroxymethylpyrimidine/phosphomethylpyrimidine kinase [uncultured Candidatus Thioglobus sp.]MBT3431598.1 hydroxymethylpyrimidine/phosphomethylpyrimidine kinase [Candidatus Thioglobus sp.]EEZ80093.1 MAG: hydroxymethylpyrimidine/phosphomethylpyrimidine kinase [uncultured Candidatus Thioglobus sp.]MBT4315571.1 hydroxymethylpyrimidine/phosphomethylpyrimidine kinase [Candidatus Thioglobus sp.]MBT4553308.1 hydroxymethylpyrimidine/phosphomethylpyrimidine kinase [Candidatus Thioglobus sp.]